MSHFFFITEENKKIADYILSLFAEDGSASQDDVHTAISERYDYDTAPFSVLQTLKDERLIYDWGEAYYKLTSKGMSAAQKGYGRYKSQQNFWQKVDKANKLTTLAKFLYGTGGFIAGWLAKVLADVLGM